MKRHLAGGLIPFVVLLLASAALADSLTLQTLALPAEHAQALKLFGGARGYRETLLHPDVPPEGVEAQVALPHAAVDANVFVTWSNNRQTSFPLVLASPFADQTILVHLMQRISTERPSSLDVRRNCEQTSPAGISPVFDMLYTCRAYTLALEDAGEAWDPDHRRALSGWLVANYRLATLGDRVSPYGLDPDLRMRLETALEREQRERWGDRRWAPLRLADARRLIELIDTRPVRMAGYVPQLVARGAVTQASAINDVALEYLVRLDQYGPVDGITRQLLLDNQSYLATLATQ
jgi:hypothetical protein